MYSAQNQEEFRGGDKTGKRWKPQRVSNYTVVMGGLGSVFLTLFFIAQMFERLDISTLPDHLNPIVSHQVQLLIAGLVLMIIAAACEAVSRLRTPPPTWRVRQELTAALGDLGLLELNHMERWQGRFAVSPIGRWNGQAKCFTVPFLLRNVNATEEKFRSMEKSIAGFARSLDCSIEQDNSRRLFNFKLVLWYANPYERIDNINPF